MSAWGGIKRDRADALFSLLIRWRDNWRCVRCGKQYPMGKAQGLDCSHFYGRRGNSTRFEPMNADALCSFPCHQRWGGDDRREYEDFKIKQLGQTMFNALTIQAHTAKKRDPKMNLLTVKALIKELETARGIKIL